MRRTTQIPSYESDPNWTPKTQDEADALWVSLEEVIGGGKHPVEQ